MWFDDIVDGIEDAARDARNAVEGAIDDAVNHAVQTSPAGQVGLAGRRLLDDAGSISDVTEDIRETAEETSTAIKWISIAVIALVVVVLLGLILFALWFARRQVGDVKVLAGVVEKAVTAPVDAVAAAA